MNVITFTVLETLAAGTAHAAFVVASGRITSSPVYAHDPITATDFSTNGRFISAGQPYAPTSVEDFDSYVRSSDANPVDVCVEVLF